MATRFLSVNRTIVAKMQQKLKHWNRRKTLRVRKTKLAYIFLQRSSHGGQRSGWNQSRHQVRSKPRLQSWLEEDINDRGEDFGSKLKKKDWQKAELLEIKKNLYEAQETSLVRKSAWYLNDLHLGIKPLQCIWQGPNKSCLKIYLFTNEPSQQCGPPNVLFKSIWYKFLNKKFRTEARRKWNLSVKWTRSRSSAARISYPILSCPSKRSVFRQKYCRYWRKRILNPQCREYLLFTALNRGQFKL